MRTLLLFLPFLSSCAPLTPEGRAYVMANLRAQQQRDHEAAMANRYYGAQAIHGPFQRRQDAQAPTYYARPDPLYPGGTIYSPRRFGY